ncbi:MAG: PAS domain S-box protein [Gammaproteobacteria bacterium]
MKRIWPASLRVRLVALVVICTLPPMALVTYTAFARYHTATRYAYSVSTLALNEVVGRYKDLISRTHNLLSVMEELPAVNAPSAECSHALATLHAKLPLYPNLVVVSLNGDFRCSALPFPYPINVADRGWFKQVLVTHRFVSGVISNGRITHRSMLVFSTPHFDDQGKIIGTLNAVVSPLVLQPTTDASLLYRYGAITVFSGDGTVLMHHPNLTRFLGSNQSQSILFKVVQAPAITLNRALPGIDGRIRFYSVQRISTDVPDSYIYVASGIDRSFIQSTAFRPLAFELAVIVAVALFIILCTWWFTTAFVTRSVWPLLRTLQSISAGDWSVRTRLANSGGEFGAIARGVDIMAEHLQARVASQQAAEYARKTSEQRYAEVVEQAMDGILVRRPSGKLLFVNEAFCRMSGYSRGELLRMNVMQLVDQSDPDPRTAELKPGETLRSEGRMRRKDGGVKSLELSAACLANGDVQLIVRDISERIEAERRINEERNLVYNAINSLQGPFFVVNVRGKFLLWNNEFERVSGYGKEEIIRMRPVDFIAPEQRVAANRNMQAVIIAGEASTGASVLTRDGRRLPYFFIGRRFEYRGETCIAGMGMDISERIAMHRKLKESEQQYRELVEQAVEGVTVRRVSGEYVLVNEAFCKMTGYSGEQLLRMRITDLIEPSEQRGHLLKIGESARFESWMYHQDGHRVPVEVSTLRLHNGDIQSVQRDISERLESRRKLEESERQYRELVEQAMVGIMVRRTSGEILFVNDALCRMTGYNRDELLHMHITQLVDPAESDAIQRVQQVATGETLQFQSRLRHKGGFLIHEELSAHRRGDGNIQLIINDITARVAAEQHLAAERDFVFHALDTLPGVFYVFNSHGKFLRWNRQMEEITGYSMEEMRSIKSADIVPPDRRANHTRHVAEILSGTGMQGETELYCKDGTRLPYYYVARHFDWQGQQCVVGMGVDIRKRKEAEQRAQIYLEELQQLSARLLAAQEEERRHIAREMHDELGQGLAVALLALKELASHPVSGALAAQISQTSAILTQLAQQVRTLSLDLRPSVLDDLGLGAAVHWYLRERVESAGLKVTLDMDKSMPRLPAHIETVCFRVLQGALTNVLRHAHAREVRVRLHLADGNLALTVQDDGAGFDVQVARRKALAGKSMGLLGMEERVRLVGGTFTITSSRGRGTEVRVDLPSA